MWKQQRYFPPLRTERGGKKNGVLPFLFLERAACRRLFRGAVKGILDQSQRRIKTSAPHFTSISPTLLEHCASAVEVNKGRLFVSASHSNDPFYLPLFFSSSTSPRLFFCFSLSLHCSPSLAPPPIGPEWSSRCTISICFLPSKFSLASAHVQ